ncbi:MAG TPA: IclR family transcriptional regulator [Pseudonocardiaceae bacterium]
MATLNTVAKVGRVLDLFAPEQPEWGVSEVAEALRIPRSSAHALLASLADIGLLQWREGGRYRIGWRTLELAETRRGMIDVRAAAAPVLARLVRTHGETCHLAVRDRMHVLYVDKLLGNHNITVQGARVGTKLDMHCTGVGKVLLAFADPGDVDEYLASIPLPRHTPNTITDKDAFRAELARIRAQGVGFDLGEAVEDVFCVAAPVRDELGQVAAAVSLSAPVNRFTKHREEYLRSVKTAATEISRAVAADERDIPARRDVNIDYPSTTPLDGPRQLGSVPRGE